jgi:hypothetical protein
MSSVLSREPVNSGSRIMHEPFISVTWFIGLQPLWCYAGPTRLV